MAIGPKLTVSRGNCVYSPNCSRGRSSVGRALQSHCRGRGFESPRLHRRQNVDSPGRFHGRAFSCPAQSAGCGAGDRFRGIAPALFGDSRPRARPADQSADQPDRAPDEVHRRRPPILRTSIVSFSSAGSAIASSLSKCSRNDRSRALMRPVDQCRGSPDRSGTRSRRE